MAWTLGNLAETVGGKLHGEASRLISGADIIRDVQPGQITLAENEQLAEKLANCAAEAAIVPIGFEPHGVDFIAVENVHAAFAKIVALFRPRREMPEPGVSPSATVSPSAKLGPRVQVHAGATIGDEVLIGRDSIIYPGVHILPGCRVGEGVSIYPNVVLYENTQVGDRVLIHAGAVIGSYGFGYHTESGRHELSAQLGGVTIEDDVEIGAGTTIDRGTYGDTVIGAGTKIDNQVQVAHNCRIGKHNLICAQVGIAGSCTTGDYVVMAGQVGLRDHIDIGAQAVLGAKSGVMNDVPSGEVFMGIPASAARQQKIRHVSIGKLPELRKEMKQLLQRVADLERQLRRDAA